MKGLIITDLFLSENKPWGGWIRSWLAMVITLNWFACYSHISAKDSTKDDDGQKVILRYVGRHIITIQKCIHFKRKGFWRNVCNFCYCSQSK